MAWRDDLGPLLADRAWLMRQFPFPHVVSRRVFRPDFYARLVHAFGDILRVGLEEARNRRRLSRSMNGYDAYGMTFPPAYDGPLSVFMSRAWHDMLSGLFDVTCTGHINCGIHHHRPGSANGWVHNDLNPAFFVDYPSADGINVVRHEVCGYTTGRVTGAGRVARRVVRRVAMLFFLSNPAWADGDGGCTGLYAHKDDRVDRPAVTVPPLNNSLLAFECTPYSFHSFITNRRPRNSVIMWLHADPSDITARWGPDRIVEWRARVR